MTLISGTLLRTSFLWAATAAVLGVSPLAAAQPCARWLDGLGVPGVSRFASGAAAWDIDGPGPRPTGFVVVGTFDLAGDVPARAVAFWDGERWEAMGDPLGQSATTVAVLDGRLFIAGLAPDGSGNRRVLERTGAGWTPVGGDFSGAVDALTLFQGRLIAAGTFASAGGTPATNIAAWNGVAWEPLGAGVSGSTFEAVTSLVVYDGRLIVGGTFTSAGGAPASRVASWDGGAWSTLGAGVDSGVQALAVFEGDLVVGGSFSSAGGLPLARVARWDGAAWRDLDPAGVRPAGGFVSDITPDGAGLIVSGDFRTIGGINVDGVARYENGVWTPLAGRTTLTNTSVRAVAIDGGRLLAAGGFRSLDGSQSLNVAVRENGAWRGTATGSDGPVYAMTEWNGELVVAGNFRWWAGQRTGGVAAWNGVSWRPLVTGAMDGWVNALAVYRGDLYAAGNFYTFDGRPMRWIARLADGVWSQPGADLPGGGPSEVLSLEVFNDRLWIGGTQENAVHRWDGQTMVASGMFFQGGAGALHNDGTNLWGGGRTFGQVARWTGTSWSSLFGFSVPKAFALETFRGQLHVGGAAVFSWSPSSVLRWNGSAWSALPGPFNGAVWDMRMIEDRLYAVGAFETVQGQPARGVAVWDGASWTALGGGVNANRLFLSNGGAVLSFRGEVVVGGDFTLASGRPSAFLARWTPTGAPWFARSPQSQTVAEGAGVALSGRAAAGYGALEYRWLRDGNVVVDGPGGASAGGGVVSGAGTPDLRIAGVRASDAGSYVLEARTAGCPWGASPAAVLTVTPACRGDVNGDGELTFDDITLFVGFFNASDPRADFNSDGEWTFDDITIFVAAYNAGC